MVNATALCREGADHYSALEVGCPDLALHTSPTPPPPPQSVQLLSYPNQRHDRLLPRHSRKLRVNPTNTPRQQSISILYRVLWLV
jgi:hypothetical protein